MVGKNARKQTLRIAFSPGQSVQLALKMLLRSWQYSVDARTEPWQFAVELSEFQQAGVTKGELRWLVAKKYALLAVEVTLPTHANRQFRTVNNIFLPDNSCLILSAEGFQLIANQSQGNQSQRECDTVNGVDSVTLSDNVISRRKLAKSAFPKWDQEKKELRLGDVVVKRFRRAAPNQELVLSAFQEAGWPARIDDPLGYVVDLDPVHRLNQTIKCLNRHQVTKLIRFRGDGTCKGVLWELLSQ